jgi:hypothetical protein
MAIIFYLVQTTYSIYVTQLSHFIYEDALCFRYHFKTLYNFHTFCAKFITLIHISYYCSIYYIVLTIYKLISTIRKQQQKYHGTSLESNISDNVVQCMSVLNQLNIWGDMSLHDPSLNLMLQSMK